MPAARPGRERLGPFFPTVGSSKLISPTEIGGRIENFARTTEGSLRGLTGTAPYMPGYGVSGGAPVSGITASIGAVPADLTYGPMHGICHALLPTGRDVLLAHTGEQIWEFCGWLRTWRCLVGPAVATPQFEMALVDTPRPRWPTQFIVTPGGIVILPIDGVPLFYDGEIVGTLGFPDVPGAPDLRGPRSPSARRVESGPRANSSQTDVNCIGYAHDGNPKYPWDDSGDYQTQMYPDFGAGRIGTVKADDFASLTGHGGSIEASALAGAVQLVDIWGNLSALSSRSAVVAIPYQSSRFPPGPGVNVEEVEHRPDLLLKQILWSRIAVSASRTCIGRVLSRTKDLLHSGTTDLFEIPAYANGGGSGAFATLPDNESAVYPDNTPDSWLVKRTLDTVPTPRARIGCLAFGSLWLANTDNAPGEVRWSQPGRWGTFARDDVMYPDPRARDITGMCPVTGGLLIFTETGAFLITPADDSARLFKTQTLSTVIGCAAPDSVRALPDGRVMWLSYDGFYAFDGQAIAYLGGDVEREIQHAARSRLVQATAGVDTASGEYRCWIAPDGSMDNDLGLIYDGEGWRRCTMYLGAVAVCSTQDHRRYMIIAGKHGASKAAVKHGVWIYNHAHNYYNNNVDVRFETSWIGGVEPLRVSIPRVVFHLREFTSSSGTRAFAFRDWRQSIDSEANELEFAYGYPDDDRPAFWGVTLYTDGYTWTRRRPYWQAVDFHLPSVETAKFVLASNLNRFDILGLVIEIEPKGEERIPGMNRGAVAGGHGGSSTPLGGPKP